MQNLTIPSLLPSQELFCMPTPPVPEEKDQPLTQSSLQVIFSQLTSPPEHFPSKKTKRENHLLDTRAAVKQSSYSFKIYNASVSAFKIFIADSIKNTEHEERVSRFVVDQEQRLFFGKEGRPGQGIGRHDQYTTKPGAYFLTGGNAFHDKKGLICGLNNKTGHLQASFDSLKWALAILVTVTPTLLSFPFTLTNHTQEINQHRQKTSYQFTYSSLPELASLIEPIFKEPALQELKTRNAQNIIQEITVNDKENQPPRINDRHLTETATNQNNAGSKRKLTFV